MTSIMAFLRRREILSLLIFILLLFSTLSIFSHPTRVISASLAWPRPSLTQSHESAFIPITESELETEESSVNNNKIDFEPLEVLAQLYEDERISLLNGYDQPSTEALIRTPAGALDPNFNTYISRLENFANTWFEGSPSHERLINMLSRLVTANPPPEEERTFEKTLYSLDKGGGEGVPDEFGYWGKRLGAEGGGDWDIKVGDDIWLDEWFREVSGQRGVDGGLPGKGVELWREMWDGLGRPVLKSDLLR